MKDFEVGCKIVLTDTGATYSTYEDFFSENGFCSKGFVYGARPVVGEVYEIMGKGTHRYNEDVVFVLLSESGQKFLSGSKYFKRSLKAAFQVGQTVKVIMSGAGCAPREIGSVVTITEIGEYPIQRSPEVGYKVSPAIGNTFDGSFGGFIGQSSFEAVTSEKPRHPYYEVIMAFAEGETIQRRDTATGEWVDISTKIDLEYRVKPSEELFEKEAELKTSVSNIRFKYLESKATTERLEANLNEAVKKLEKIQEELYK